MRYTRWTFALPAFALMLSACEGTDRDAYAGTPEGETPEATPTMEEETTGIEAEWDMDASGDLDENEFRTWWSDRSAELDWNTDQEEGLTREEYYEGVVNRLDGDGDGRITQQEWQDRTSNMWGDATPAQWSSIDADGDGTATTEEARRALEEADLYANVDENNDEVVNDEELGNWFHGVFDLNDDGRIDSSEWNPGNWFDSGN